MISTIRNIFSVPELRRRLFITIALLGVFRLGCVVPIPGVNTAVLSEMMAKATQGAYGGIFGLLNLFTGGAFTKFAVFGLGVMPYISASIIIQLLTTSVPYLENLSKEGESGRKKIRRIERYVTLALCVFQSYVMVKLIERGSLGSGGEMSVISPLVSNLQFEIMAVMAMAAGSLFLMWIGEQMTEFGIGNGISLIIMGGIVARVPSAVQELLLRVDWKFESAGDGKISILYVIVLAAVLVAIVLGVVLITQAQRRIPMQQAKQTRGRRVVGGQRHYMPLRVNQAGVIPIIFASSLLIFPTMIINALHGPFPWLYNALSAFVQSQGFIYITLYMTLIVFFCFFWTAVTFNPTQMSENLRDYGSFIPGIRPGRRTAEYLEHVMMRITLAGAGFLAVIAALPQLMSNMTRLGWGVTSFFGGTGLLIVVGVALDLVERIETHLLMRHYEGFMRKGRVRGRR